MGCTAFPIQCVLSTLSGSSLDFPANRGEGIDCLVLHPGYTRVYCPDR